jgi:hypothetical protein
MIGFFNGCLNAYFGLRTDCINAVQNKNSCEYVFRIRYKPIKIKARKKVVYDKLNYLQEIKGFTLQDALKSGIFQLRQSNRIYFRGRPILNIENTLFHIISNYNLLLDQVPHISHNFFKKIIKKTSADERKIILLKTLMQVLGWGIVKIVIKNRREIIMEIRNPPYGLQIEKDNWKFLCNVILGYLWLIDKKFKIKNIILAHKKLDVTFSVKN